jgi:hypothetical protein
LAPAIALLVAMGVSGEAKASTLGTEPGAAREQIAASTLEVVPNVIRFPEVPLGETYTQTVRLANLGKSSMQINKISIGAGGFGISGFASPVVLLPESSTNVTISYRPKAAGHLAVQMKIVTSTDAAPVAVDVTATAIDSEAELTATEASVHFDDVPIGGRSVKEISLTNTGSRNLQISEISVSGGDFGVSGGNQVSLSPGQSVSLKVDFAPKDMGDRSGTLSVRCEGSASPVQIALSGAGAQSSPSAITLKWENSPLGAQGYVVYRSLESGGPYERVSSGAVDSAEYTDTGLAAGHTYYYVVTSLDADNKESEFSEQITATVP